MGESCAYENASRTPRDTRNSMEVHLARGAKRQETAQGAFDFDASRQGLTESRSHRLKLSMEARLHLDALHSVSIQGKTG